MELNVMVKKDCEYNGVSYVSVVIAEKDIRKLAEEKAKDNIHSPDSITFEGQEIELKGVL